MRNFIAVVVAIASTEFLSFLSGSTTAASAPFSASLVASALVVPPSKTKGRRVTSSSSSSSGSGGIVGSCYVPRSSHQPLASSVAESDTDTCRNGKDEEEKANSTEELSPMLQEIVDERHEFQMNVGRALDVLRKDYPDLLKREFDFGIYHTDIQVKDPSGVQFSKLSAYKNSLTAIRLMANLAYDVDSSYINNRMVYDAARGQIRVSFNAVLFPKVGVGAFGIAIGGGGVGGSSAVTKPVHVDGISVYTLDRTRKVDGGEGKIIEHRIERILVNDQPVRPPYFGLGQLANNHAHQRQGGVVAGAWS